jgi:hypothetical protein
MTGQPLLTDSNYGMIRFNEPVNNAANAGIIILTPLSINRSGVIKKNLRSSNFIKNSVIVGKKFPYSSKAGIFEVI